MFTACSKKESSLSARMKPRNSLYLKCTNSVHGNIHSTISPHSSVNNNNICLHTSEPATCLEGGCICTQRTPQPTGLGQPTDLLLIDGDQTFVQAGRQFLFLELMNYGHTHYLFHDMTPMLLITKPHPSLTPSTSNNHTHN